MQMYIKYLVWGVVTLMLTPFIAIGFLAATFWGSAQVGFDLAVDMFVHLGNWIADE